MSQSAVVFISILCVASHSGNASFLTNLSENVTATRSHVTFSDCKADCESRSRCAEAQYHRRYKLCQFLKHPSNARTPGVTNYIKLLSRAPDKLILCILSGTLIKPLSKLKNQTDVCKNCTNTEECIISYEKGVLTTTCVTENCLHPEPLEAAITYGNILSVRSKIKFDCIASEEYSISECLRNGTWSAHDLQCVCRPSKVPNGVVQLVQIAPDVVMAETTCDQGYTLLQMASPVCNTTNNTWSPSFDNVCCDILYDNEWQKIFRYQGGTSLAVIPWWRSEGTDPEMVNQQCSFRNATILADWNGAVTLSKVKFNIIKDEQVVAYLIFDAYRSYRQGWFAQKRLLNSSWTDLNQTTDLEFFSAHGKLQHNDMVRFFIGKSLHDDRCEEDTGWLAVSSSWTVYPCNGPESLGSKIVYSPLDTFTHLSNGSVEVADRFEVWITEL